MNVWPVVMHSSRLTPAITASRHIHHHVRGNVVGDHVSEWLSVSLPTKNVQLLAFLRQSNKLATMCIATRRLPASLDAKLGSVPCEVVGPGALVLQCCQVCMMVHGYFIVSICSTSEGAVPEAGPLFCGAMIGIETAIRP